MGINDEEGVSGISSSFFHQFTCRKKIAKKKKTFSRNFLLLRTQEEEEGGDRSLTVPTYANDRLRSPPLNKEEEKIEISLVDSLRPVVG
jgi:hypothetical protein